MDKNEIDQLLLDDDSLQAVTGGMLVEWNEAEGEYMCPKCGGYMCVATAEAVEASKTLPHTHVCESCGLKYDCRIDAIIP